MRNGDVILQQPLSSAYQPCFLQLQHLGYYTKQMKHFKYEFFFIFIMTCMRKNPTSTHLYTQKWLWFHSGSLKWTVELLHPVCQHHVHNELYCFTHGSLSYDWFCSFFCLFFCPCMKEIGAESLPHVDRHTGVSTEWQSTMKVFCHIFFAFVMQCISVHYYYACIAVVIMHCIVIMTHF